MKLSTYVIGVPAAVIAAVVAVANRQSVRFSLDPLSQNQPALAFHLPLFVALFAALLVGVLLGGLASLLGRMTRRRPAPDGKKEQNKQPLPIAASAGRLLPWNRGKPKSGPR